MITLSDISVSYSDVLALNNLSLHITEQRTTVLIGPSGCGKSTILRLITGLTEPDGGQLSFYNKPIDGESIRDLRLNLGYVIQEGGLFPHLTIEENLSLMPSYLKWTKDRIEERMDILMGMFHLSSSLLQRYPMEISGGQRQRVSLIRALMLDPQLLLLDEPLGALDSMIRYDLQLELKQMFSQMDKTVLMVTHDLSEAAFFADNIVLMKEGNIVQQGSFQEILDNPRDEFVRKFISAQKSTWQRD